MSARAGEIGADELLVVEDLTKQATDIHDRRYMPAVSLLAGFRSRGRRMTLDGGVVDDGDDDMGGDDGGDDEDELDEREDQQEFEPEVVRSKQPLRELTFRVRSGEAVGVLGDRNAADALVRMLAGMSAPSGGRILARGRVGFSWEFARLLTRYQSGGVPGVLAAVAAVSGVPRRHRAAWVSDAVTLIGGGVPPDAWSWDEAEIRMRVAFAVSFDPTASVLVIDRWPSRSDAAFYERCLDLLRSRLADGASAVVTCVNLDVISQVCTDAVWLEHGRLKRHGPAPRIVEDFRLALRGQDSSPYASTPGFNADIAILGIDVLGPGGRAGGRLSSRDQLRLHVRFETSAAETSVACRVRFEGPVTQSFAQPEPLAVATAGSYAAVATIPPGTLPEGDYRVGVEAIVVRNGKRSSVMRAASNLLRIEGDGDGSAPTGLDSVQTEWSMIGDPGVELS